MVNLREYPLNQLKRIKSSLVSKQLYITLLKMDNMYMKGELLQLHTKNREIVEGRFYSMTNDLSKISLYDVKENAEGDKSDGIIHYYDSEVSNIVKVRAPNDHTYLKISQKECEDMIKIAKKYIYINQVDTKYRKAIEDLNLYNFIAVSTDGADMGRKCKMPFLVLSTPEQIYIIDVQVMQHHAFDNGLKALLESHTPKKIIHDSRKISDCLFHKHNVKLKSVFDTQVGDIIINKNKTGVIQTKVKTLGECLNVYLGLKQNSIEEKLDIVKCTERPLTTDIKEHLSRNISYLHRLSEAVSDEMMLPFVRGAEYFVDNLRSCDDFKAWEQCGNYHKLPQDFQNVIQY